MPMKEIPLRGAKKSFKEKAEFAFVSIVAAGLIAISLISMVQGLP